MAAVSNDRDLLLQGSIKRVEQALANSIVLSFSSPRFVVNNNVVSPQTITVSASFTGQLYGEVTFTILQGLSSINTSTPNVAVVSYSALTADVCSVRASLNFFGVTYTTDFTVEGKVTAPIQVASPVSISPEGASLRLSWPKNPEADVRGYEVRTTDSGWGDQTFAYRGGTTSCLVTPGTLGTPVTWYVRAYDDSSLYSGLSRSASYTVARPSVVTGLEYGYAPSSGTSSTLEVFWAPASPTFGFRSYRVATTPPGGSTTSQPVSNPFISVDANWVGETDFQVFVTDLLGNESFSSAVLSVEKSLPAVPTGILVNPVGTELLVRWTDAVKTTLPVSGYELRRVNSAWGVRDVNFVWRGNTSEAKISTPVLGSNTYYLNTFDTDNRYATTGTLVSYTVLRPGVVTGITAAFSGTTATNATVRVSWVPPAVTSFAPSKYIVTLSKSGEFTQTITVAATSLTFEATWAGSANLSITTVDSLENTSATAASFTITKQPPGVPGVSSFTITDTSANLSWIPSAQTSLPIAGYEIRSSISGWGDTGYIARSYTNSIIVPNLTSGTTTRYIKSFDTSGEFSTHYRTATIAVVQPNPVSNITITYSDTNISGAQSQISWTQATPTSFPLRHYVVTITKSPSNSVSVFTVAGNTLSLPVDWHVSATVSILSIDLIGQQSTAAQQVFTKAAPSTPTAFSAAAVASGSVSLSWIPSTTGTLPIEGYEIRTTSSGAGTPGYLYRGNSPQFVVPRASLGTTTWYLWAYDTDGQYSTASAQVSFSTISPATVTGLTATFNTSSNTSSSVIFRWDPSNGSSFSIDRYEVSFTYSSPVQNTLTSNRYTNDWEIPANWLGSGTLSVRAIDILSGQSAISTLVVPKAVPSQVGAASTSISGTSVLIDWPDNIATTLPVTAYELRSTNTGWGTPGFIWKGSSSNTLVPLTIGTGSRTWYIRAIDSDGQYSTSSRSVSYNVLVPINPSIYPAEFVDTSLTAATVSLYWDPVSPPLGLLGYEVTYAGVMETVNATTITVPANWQGSRTFTVKTIDRLGNMSTGVNIVATQLPPNPVTNLRGQVIDNNVLLYWELPEKTTLPIAHVNLRKGNTWADAEVIGNKDGTFTYIQELQGGDFTYWISAVDTDNHMSTPVALQLSVTQPPDFVFNAEFISTLNGTRVNAAYSDANSTSIILPVHTTETFGAHFTVPGWAGPSAQISAGYPIYAQPGLSSGSYTEVFDYGTILGGSQITATVLGTNVSGTPAIQYTISVSLDGVDYTDYPGGSSVFATNFRYVRLAMVVSQVSAGDLYKINSITVRLDAKQRTDANTVSALASDSLGTIVNFSTEFVDVTSINLTAGGTTSVTPVYDFLDAVITGTYSVTANVATINAAGHSLLAGQKVRIYIATGAGINAVYQVSSVINANSYTVNMVCPNTSGNVSTYPNSFRVYVFTNPTTRASAPVSWTVRGY